MQEIQERPQAGDGEAVDKTAKPLSLQTSKLPIAPASPARLRRANKHAQQEIQEMQEIQERPQAGDGEQRGRGAEPLQEHQSANSANQP